MTTPGVLVASQDGTSWAWGAIRLTPALTLGETRAYHDVDRTEWLSEVLMAERAWHRTVGTTTHRMRYELRYHSRPQDQSVSCVLLFRVEGPVPAAVASAAVEVRDRLLRTPRHVRSEPVNDTDEVVRLLTIHPAEARDIAELRKPLHWAWCTRRDTGRAVSHVVPPLSGAGQSWERVWHEMAGSSHPTMLSVLLIPYVFPPAITQACHALAAEYARLAAPGPESPVWSAPARPDPFAVTAAPGYAAMSRRYPPGPVHRARVSVVAGASMAGFPELVAGTLGGLRVCRPVEGEWDQARANLSAMNNVWLDRTHRQGFPPGAFTAAERVLTDVVDADEVTVLFRFPAQIPGHLPLFTSPPAAGAVGPGSRTLTVDSGDPGAPRFER